MPQVERRITPADILPLDRYQAERKAIRARIVAQKQHRRVEVGPYATFYFENWETMWAQIQEMLYIEKGGDEQLADEMHAYNPLIPQGAELIATVMFEIDDPLRRANVLSRLGGVEETMFIQVGDEKIMADPEHDVDRTTPDGKTSSVHFLHFRFTPQQIARFRDPAVQVLLGIGHQNYAHLAILQPPVRASLGADFAA
jgi:hypothetical protein